MSDFAKDTNVPCNDTISRQAAIDALAELARDRFTVQDVYQVYLDALKDADMRIRQLPSAQQEQRWIPCSERLPKVGQTVICQCRADILKLLKLDSGGDWYQDAEHVYMNGFVIAWMPLPEPYKGEVE